MATSYAFKPIVTDGLVFYVDAANSKSYYDASWVDLFSGYSGVLSNGANFNNLNGGVISFDGVDDGVDFPNLGLPNYGARSLMVWLKSTGENACSVMAYGDVNTPQGSNILHLNIIGVGSIYWGFNDGDFYTDVVMDSGYNFISCTYNGGVLNTDNVKIYLNGIQLSTTSAGNNIGGYPATINSNYTIGYDSGIRYFSGDISNIGFYNRELSQEEVLQNYNASKNRFI